MLVIDGNALIHRSFHALPPTMKTKDGQMTNAVYGFTAVLIKALKEFKPAYAVLTLDKKAPTFRHEEYKEYKAHRVKQPDELYEQISLVKNVAGVFNIPIYEKEGFEADDLIGTIADKTDGRIEKIIVTGDMDTLQLVNDHTKVYTMSRGLADSVIYDREAVIGRYGLAPEQMTDYKGLRGDPSDNIPGVRGIGEKTAGELLKEFGTIEKLYESVEEQAKSPVPAGRLEKPKVKNESQKSKIKERILELLTKGKDEAFLSKRLATIRRDAPIEFDPEKARFGSFDQTELVQLFSELEFKSLLPRIKEIANDRLRTLPAGQQSQNGNAGEKQEARQDKFERNKRLFSYVLVDDEKKFASFLAKLKKQKAFAVDTETTGFDPLASELLGVSFSWKEGEAHYVRIADKDTKIQKSLFDNIHKEKDGEKEAGNHSWLEKLKPILEDEKIKKAGHNIKFDLRVLRNNGIDVRGLDFDTMLAAYLLNPGSRQHNLDAVAFAEFGFEKISKDDLLGKGREKIGFAEVPAEKLSLYSCEDADFTNRLAKRLLAELKKLKIERLFREIEMPLVPVLAEMEDNGIRIDAGFLGRLKKEVDGKIKKLEAKIQKLAGAVFNVNSTQQLRAVLFEKLEISAKDVAKNKTGFSTAAEELEKLKDAHPIIRPILEYRELAKLSSTYIDALPALINPKTGRLHTSYNQAVTATGRLSSTEPNLQNIPVRTELGREIRKAFTAEPGHKLLSLDYSQIELRLAAHMSGDKKMIRAFRDKADIHAATAAEINGVPLAEVTPAMRREAKAINFGILYGQGPHGLSQTADIPYEQARKFIEKYFETFSGVKKFIDQAIAQAHDKGRAETLFGRRRYLPEINSSVMQVRKAAERMAVNTPLQGTAADMIKKAMIEIARQPALKPASCLHPSPDSFSSPTPSPSSERGGKMRPGQDGGIMMLLQVHDELLFEVPENEVGLWAEEIGRIMENVIKLDVPIIVDARAGDNWGELKDLKS